MLVLLAAVAAVATLGISSGDGGAQPGPGSCSGRTAAAVAARSSAKCTRNMNLKTGKPLGQWPVCSSHKRLRNTRDSGASCEMAASAHFELGNNIGTLRGPCGRNLLFQSVCVYAHTHDCWQVIQSPLASGRAPGGRREERTPRGEDSAFPTPQPSPARPAARAAPTVPATGTEMLDSLLAAGNNHHV